MADPAAFEREVRPLLEDNCVACHSERNQTAGFAFDIYPDEAAALAQPYVWEDVRKVLERGVMPPPGLPRPAHAHVQALIAWIDESLEEASANLEIDPGRVTARRLNRTEYNNTIRDLLGVRLRPADEFPVDDSGYGFDNIADVLTVSPVLMEKYLEAAGKVARAAIVARREVPKPAVVRYNAPRADGEIKAIGPTVEMSYSPEGRLELRHRFPATGVYEFDVNIVDRRTMPERRPRWMNELDAIIPKISAATEAKIDVETAQRLLSIERDDAWLLLRGNQAKRIEGGYVIDRQDLLERLEERHEWTQANPEPPVPPPPPTLPVPFQIDGKTIETLYAAKKDYAKGTDPFRRKVKAGERLLFSEILDPEGNRWDPNAQEWKEYRRDKDTHERILFVDSVQIKGPYEAELPPLPESHRNLVECSPKGAEAQERCAKRILSKLVRRAFRRPVAAEEIDRYVGLVKLATSNGAPFEEGLQTALQAILVSPRFLFRIERDPAEGEGPRRLSGYELAARLSYFLWSSMPDDELLTAAGQGDLDTADGINSQIRRMLADDRSGAFVENFAGQWLQLRNLATSAPDPELFPEFNDRLRRDMRTETELFVGSILREDRSVLEMLSAKYTFLNERLAKHYGLGGVTSEEFRKVEVDGDRRGGLLSQASVLTVSSYPTRTSPVLRGIWVLENILDSPPPPPPPDTPVFDEATVGKEASLREQLAQHRADPSCAVCHDKMDALGLGLENYDPIGRWREKAGAFAVDASGELPGGLSFNGPGQLKEILRNSEGDRFVRALTEKTLTYALGRGLERTDTPAVKDIEKRLAENGYRFSELIAGVVESAPFLMRRGEGAESDD